MIHSQYQWAFCIQLSISKTTLVRNEHDWCKNTELLQSKVFTHVLVSGDWGKKEKQKACFSKWRKGSCTLTPWCKAVDPGASDWEDKSSFFLSNVETKEFLQQESFHDEGLQFCVDPSLQYYAATLLSFWENTTHNKSLEPPSTFFFFFYTAKKCILHFNNTFQ